MFEHVHHRLSSLGFALCSVVVFAACYGESAPSIYSGRPGVSFDNSCELDSDCAGEQVCRQGTCGAPSNGPWACTFDSDCGADEVCSDAGTCRPCEGAECAALGLDQTCLETGCDGDEICNEVSGLCEAPAGQGPGDEEPGDEEPGDQDPVEPVDCDAADPGQLREAAAVVLETFCANCHNPNGPQGGGAFKNAADIDSVVEAQLVLVGSPETSPLIERMRSEVVVGDKAMMPPAGIESRPTEEDIAAVEDWIRCIPIDEPPVGVDHVTTEDVMSWIHADLSAFSPSKRRDMRYVTLHHLYNAGDDEETLARHRDGVAKLVNSLSWADAVYKPFVVDARGLIMRLDVDDLEWKADSLGGQGIDVWSLIETAYPYAIHDENSDDEYNSVYSDTEVERTVYVHADWLAATAASPPLYHEILQLPDTQQGLEALIGVEVEAGIANHSAVRAGFTFSNVSVNNRVIERHALGTITDVQGTIADYDGAFWISYDFASNQGVQNIFNFPVGFVEDGHEIIFNLPNGLQAYMITAANGDRIDTAPVTIVSDSYSSTFHLAPEVSNGLSCISCHFNGMNYAEDDVLNIIQSNNTQFSPDVVGAASQLYKSPDDLNPLFDQDRLRFEFALNELGITHATGREEEPTSQLAFGHFRPMDLAEVAATVGMSEEQFLGDTDSLARLKNSRAEIATLVNNGGLIKRDVFDESFRDITCFMGQGSPVTEGLNTKGEPNGGCAISKFCNINSPFPNATAALVIDGVELLAADGVCSPCRSLPVGEDIEVVLRFEEVVKVQDSNGQLVPTVQVLAETVAQITIDEGVDYVITASSDGALLLENLDPGERCENSFPSTTN